MAGQFPISSTVCVIAVVNDTDTGFCQVEDEEEEKRGETVQAPPDGSVTETDEVHDKGSTTIL